MKRTLHLLTTLVVLSGGLPLAAQTAPEPTGPAVVNAAEPGAEAGAQTGADAPTDPPPPVAESTPLVCEPAEPVAAIDGPRPIGDVVALGVVSVGSLAGSIAMLVAASQTHSDYEATGTELLIDQERRQTLSQREDAQNILGYTLLGVSSLSGAGFGVLLHRHLSQGRPDATITLAPSVGLRQVGVRLGARF